MKTVRFHGDERVDVIAVKDPAPCDNHVVVKVMASGICGTERHAYRSGMSPTALEAGILNAGHEGAGIVWKASAASRLKEGDRVNLFSTARHCGRCRYCASGRWVLCQGEPPAPGFGYHAQLVLRREDFCLPLGDDIDFDVGALLGDVLGTAYRAIRRLSISSGESVLIMGQGPIGLAATMICDFMGATVVSCDPSAYRLDLARRCGSKETVDPTNGDVPIRVVAITGSEGVDAAIDCSGVTSARLTCLEVVRRGGRVAMIGLSDGLELDAPTFQKNVFRKDLDLVSSWYSNPLDMFDLEDLVRAGLDPLRMVTHVLPIDRAAHGYTEMFSGKSGKVILHPWDDVPTADIRVG